MALNLVQPRLAEATTNDTVNFQARLEGNDGAIVNDGYYNVEFKLYSVSSGGSALWTEDYLYNGGSPDQRVKVVNGYLSVNLGSITAFPSTISWDQPLYIGMNVGGSSTSPTWDGEMSPRLRLTAVPYAFQAKSATQLQTQNGANVATLSFTPPTATDSIVLPDASGTVCLDQTVNNCSYAPLSGSSNYIQNGTSLQTSANFNIQSVGTTSVTATLQLLSGQTADLLRFENSAGTAALSGINSSGELYYQSGSFTGTLVQDSLGQNTVYHLPDPAGASDTFCLLTAHNCVGTGGSISGSGTQNYVTKFNNSGGSNIGDSSIYDNGSFVGINTTTNNGLLSVVGSNASQAGIFVQPVASATAPAVVIKGGATPGSGADLIDFEDSSGTVLAKVDSSGTVYAGGSAVIGATTAPSGTTGQLTVVTSGSTIGQVIQAGASQTADLLDLLNSNGNIGGGFSAGGNQLTLGYINTTGTPTAGKLILGDGNTDGHSTTVQTASSLAANNTITIPDAGGSDTVCLYTLQNCVGTGGGITGSGTQYYIAKFDTAGGNHLGNSSVYDNGSFVGLNTTTNSGLLSLVGAAAGQSTLFAQGTASATVPVAVIKGGATPGSGADLLDLSTSSGLVASFDNAGNFTTSGTATLNGGLTVVGATSINTTGTQNTAIGNSTGTFSLTSSGLNVTTAGALSGITTISASGSISAATSSNTINGLVINSGALSGITGYSQASGNFGITGSGTFSTGTGNISLNGATTLDSNFTQNYSSATNNDVAATFNVTNTNASATTTTVNAQSIALTGTTNSNSNANIVNGLNFANVTPIANNSFNALVFGTGYNSLLDYNGATLINGSGLLQNAAIDSSQSYTNLQKVGALSSGSITSGFGTISTGNNISTTAALQGGSLTVSGLATFNGGATIATGNTFTNNASTLFGSVAISNHTTGGNIGTAAATVDGATTFDVTQTTSGQNLTLPNPTNTASGRIVYVNSLAGNATFTMYGVTIAAGTSEGFIWNGSAWVATSTGATGVNTIGAIDSQSKSANGAVISGSILYLQTADASAPGLVSTGVQTFAGDKTFNGAVTLGAAGTALTVTNTASIGTLTLGNALTVGNGGTGAGSFTSNGVVYGNGSGALQVTAAGTAGQVLLANGSGVPTFTTVSGDVTVDGSGVTTIGAGKVTNADLANSSLTVTGGTNLTGGGSVALGSSVTLNVSNSPTFSGDVTVQGTNGVTVGSTSNNGKLKFLDGTADGFIGTVKLSGAITANQTYTLPTTGGTFCLTTGNCTAAGSAGGDLTGSYPNPTIAKLQGSTLTITSPAGGDLLLYNGSAFVNQSVTGDVTINASGVTTIGAGKVTNADLLNSSLTVTAGTGLTGGGSVSLGGSTSLSVSYGSASGTAVQGNTTLVCPSGTGNLSGGGNTITLGAGGSCSGITIVNSPTFSGNLAVQGSTGVTIGSTTNNGALSFLDGTSDGFTGTIQLSGAIGANQIYNLPTTGGTICLDNSSACGFATGSGAAFINGGNNFGGNGTLGTTGAGQSLSIETAGSTRATFDTSGNLSLQSGAYEIGGSSVLSSSALTFTAASANTVRSSNNQNLTVQTQGTGQLILNSANGGLALQSGGTTQALVTSGALTFQQATTITNVAQSASNTAGYDLTVNGGAGNGTGAGGALNLNGGAATATAGSNGGAVNISAGNGSSTGAGGAGGGINLTAGSGNGTAANAGGTVALQGGSSNAGNGGGINLTGGAANASLTNGGSISINGGQTNGGSGGSGGNVVIQGGFDNTTSGGQGGNVSIDGGFSSNGVQGFLNLGTSTNNIHIGGTSTFNLTVQAATTLTGSTSGGTALQVTTPGGSVNGSSLGVSVAALNSTAGNGAAAGYLISTGGGAGQTTTGTTGVTAGSGSLINLTSGAGGAATGASGANTGGNGGNVTIASGAGGNVTSATGTAGSGGTITIQGGAAGTGGSTAGKIGNVILQGSGGNVGIGTSGAPAALLSVGGATGNFQVNNAGNITGVLSATTGANLVCQNASNVLATCTNSYATGSGAAFINGGNNFGGNATLGTTGAGQTLVVETAGSTRATFDTSGNLNLANGGAFQINSGTTLNATNLNFGGAGTIQSASGSNLTVQSQGTGQLTLNSASNGLALQSGGSTVATLTSGNLSFNLVNTTIGFSNVSSTANSLTIQGMGSNTGTGGNVTINAGVGNSLGTGGVLALNGGTAGAFANGGAVTITGGAGGASAGGGGAVTVQGGNAGNAGAGGLVTIQGGTANASAGSAGGGVTVQAANGSSTGAGAAGGNVIINAGNAGGTGANAGGNITVQAGSATSTGAVGTVTVKNVSNSVGSFQVQNASGLKLLGVDTTNSQVGIGQLTTPSSAPVIALGGSLSPGNYYIRVTAIDATGGESAASTEFSATASGTCPGGGQCEINITWPAVTGAVSYRVYYGTSAGGEANYFPVATNSYTMTTTAGSTAGSPPAISTAYINHITGSGSGTNYLTNTTVRTATNSATGFQVQNASGASILAVDTTGNGNLTVGNASNPSTITFVGGATASRPASPTKGQLYYDTSTNQLVQYNGSKWVGDARTATKIVAASNSTQAEKDAADYIATGTNDATTINSALTALPAGGGIVYLEEGTYTLGATSISVPDNTTLSGSGSATILTYPNSMANATYKAITNSDTTTGTNVYVQNLMINGNGSNQTTGTFYGILFNGMGAGAGNTARAGGKIINVIADNLYNGAAIEIDSSANNTISNNTTANTYAPGYGYGIELSASNNNTLDSNLVQGNDYGGLNLANSSNNTLTGNTVQGNGGVTDGDGIDLDSSSSYNTLTGNTANGNGLEGIAFNTSAGNNTLSANTTEGNGDCGIGINTSGNTVTGNTTKGNSYGMCFNSDSYNTITGNTIQANTNKGINLNTSTNNTVASNKIHDNGGATTNEGIVLESSSTQNSITSNDITDTSCSSNCYAIDITDAGSTGNYLGLNHFVGDGTHNATINDATASGNTYSGQQLTQNGDASFRNATNSTTAFQIQNASGTGIFDVDASSGRVGIGTSAPSALLSVGSGSPFQVNNSGNVTAVLGATTGGTLVCQNGSNVLATCTSSYETTTGTDFIRNQTTVQNAANFYVRSGAVGSVAGVIEGANGQTADLLDLNSYNGASSSTVAKFDKNGVLYASGISANISPATAASNGEVIADTLRNEAGGGPELQWSGNETNLVITNNRADHSTKIVGSGTGSTDGATLILSGSGNDLLQLQNASGSNLLRVDGNANIESSGYFNNGIGGIGLFSNLLTYSEQLDNAAWTATSMTVTANSTIAPDGQTTAETLADTASGGSVAQTSSTAPSNNNYTFSVYLKTSSGSQAVGLRIDGSATGTGTVKNVTATTTWQRFFVTQNTNGFTGNINVDIFPGTTGGSGTVIAWGAQLVKDSNPEVYVRTTGATEAANSGVVSNGGAFISAINANDIPLQVQGAPSQSSDLFQVLNSSGQVMFNVQNSGAGQIGICDTGQGQGCDFTLTGNNNNLTKINYANNNGTIRLQTWGGTTLDVGNQSIALTAQSLGQVPLIINGASGQNADLLQVRSSTPTTLFNVNSTGQVYATTTSSAGTATYGFQGDTSTGLTSLASGVLALTANGSEKLRARSYGVGIGGIDPSATLTVNGAVAGVALNVVGANATDAPAIQVQNAGSYINAFVVGSGGNYLNGTVQNDTGISFSGNKFDIGYTNLAPALQISSTGATTLKNTSNSAAAFQIQNTSGSSGVLFNADTSNMRISVGTAGTASGQLYVSGSVPSGSLASYSNFTDTAGVVTQGSYAYVVDNSAGKLDIVDITKPASPVQVGSVSIASAFRVFVQGRYAYVTDNGSSGKLYIVDISNPASPTIVGTSVQLGNTFTFKPIYVQGRYAYVGNQTSNLIYALDVSNPANPTVIGTVSVVDPEAIAGQGNFIYVVDDNDGRVYPVNIGNPTNMVAYPYMSVTGGNPMGIVAQGRYAYVVAGSANNVNVLDISNPSAPTVVTTVATDSTPVSLALQGRYLYVFATGAQKIDVIDVSNPASPVSVGSVSGGNTNMLHNPLALAVQGRYAYLVDHSTHLLTYDLGGEYAQQFQAGGIETGTLQVDGNSSVSGDQSIQGGLSVSASTELGGNVGIGGTLLLQPASNNQNALQIMDNASNSVLNVNTNTGQTTLSSTNLAFPSTPVLDTFTGTNGTTPPDANWTTAVWGDSYALKIASNAVTANGSPGTGSGAWNTALTSSNAEAYVTTSTLPAGGGGDTIDFLSCTGVACNPNGYGVLALNNTLQLMKIASGTPTNIGNAISQVFTAGDSYGIRRVGNQLSIWYKTASGGWNVLETVTDSTYNINGYYMALEASDNVVALDNFGGGNLTNVEGNALTAYGTGLFQTTGNNSTTAFQVQNASGTSVLTVDTTNQQVIAGAGSTGTISSAGEWDQHGTNQSTDAITTHAVGNIVVVGVDISTSGVTLTGLSGGNVSNWTRVTYTTDATHRIELWEGKVTSTGAGTITATFSSTPASFVEIAAQEFTAGLGSSTVWQIDNSGTINNASSTTIQYPTFTPSASNALYWGYAQTGTTGSGGFSSGFSYIVTSAGATNVIAYNPSGSGVLSPLASTSGAAASNVVALVLRAGTTSLNINGSATGSGQLTLQNTSTTALQVQNASGTSALTVDTSNLRVDIGTIGTPTGQLYVSGTVPSAVLGTYTYSAGLYSMASQGRYIYASTFSKIAVFDDSNAASPTSVGSVTTTGTSNLGIAAQGHYVYTVANSSNLLEVIDVSNPASPVQVGSATTGNGPVGLVVQGRYAYVANQTANSFQIFDISNPNNPVLLSTLAGPGNTYTFAVVGNYAYVTSSSSLYVINIGNPYNPSVTGTYAAAGQALTVQGRYVYMTIGGTNGTLDVIDVSNPASPILAGTVTEASNTGTGIRIAGRTLYVLGTNMFQTFDISNPASPYSLGTTATNSAWDLMTNGRYLYITSNSSSTIQVFDLGGSYIQSAEIGAAEIGNLQVNNNANFSGGLSVGTGLAVGQSAVINGNLGVGGSALLQNATDSLSAFQVATSAGDILLNASTSSNYINNSGFESGIGGWAAVGSATPTQSSTIAQQGTYSMQIASGVTGNSGASYNFSLVNGQSYTFSFYAATSSGSITDLAAGFINGGQNSCSLNSNTVSTTWVRYTCTFTAGSASTAVYITRTGTTNETFYVDNAQLALSNTATNTNLITNGDFGHGTNGWAAKGVGSAIAQTTNSWQATYGMMATTTTTTNAGASYTIPLTNSQTYTLSFYASVASGSITDLGAGWINSGTDSTCSLNINTVTTGWARYSCTFTAGSASTAIFIEKTGSSSETLYIDGVQLQTGSNASAFGEGFLQLAGIINSPVAIQNATNSAAALQVQNANGATLLSADTSAMQVVVKSGSTDATEGSNLFAGFNTIGGWTNSGSGATMTSTHTNGGGTTALTSTWTATAGTTYEISFTYTNCTVTKVLGVSIGSYGTQNIETNSACVGTDDVVITANNSGALTFTPGNIYDGTISAVTIKAITQTNDSLAFQSAGGTTTLQVRSSGSNTNTFIGLSSGLNNTSSGLYNTAVGGLSLQNNTSGQSNTGIGQGALSFNTNGNYNTAVGNNALTSNTTGAWNTAIGMDSQYYTTTGQNNNSVGAFALFGNTTGQNNNAQGAEALYSNSTGSGNIGIGPFAAYTNVSGNNLTAIGYSALYNATGGNNSAFGSSAGETITTGTNNTFAGLNSGDAENNNHFQTLGGISNSGAFGAYAQVQASNTIVLGSVDNATQIVIGSTRGVNGTNSFGVSPVDLDSATITATQSGTTTITASSAIFSANNVGEQLIWADGSTETITGFTSTTVVTGSASLTETGQYFRTHHIGLQVQNNGDAYVQGANSTTAFQILGTNTTNGNSLPVLTADTTNDIVQVGSSTASTNGILLALNNYNAALHTEPTEVDGAMYYNTTLSTFRCGVAGAWENCGGLDISNTATASCTNTTTPTSCTPNNYYTGAAPSIPANYCVAGRIIHVHAAGIYSGQTTASSLTFSVRLAGTIIGAASPAVTAGVSGTSTNQQWNVDFYITCDSGTTVTGEGIASVFTTAAGTANIGQMTGTGTTTVTNSSAQAIQLYVNVGATADFTGITLEQFVVQGQ